MANSANDGPEMAPEDLVNGHGSDSKSGQGAPAPKGASHVPHP